MRQRPLIAALCVSALTFAPLSSLSADDYVSLELGDDTGDWANDGECDDIRFTGDGMSEVLLTDSIGKDASDCGAALKAEKISVDPMHAQPSDANPINFGDDASQFANDGQCDDIRFAGSDAAEMVFIAEDVGHDASDCKAAFDAGNVKWQGSTATPELGVTANEIIEQISGDQITT